MNTESSSLNFYANIKRVDWLAVLILGCIGLSLSYKHNIALLLNVAAVYLLITRVDVRRLWLKVFAIPFALAVAYLLGVAGYSPYRHDAYEDVWSLTRALFVSVPLIYIVRLPLPALLVALRWAVGVLAGVTLTVLYQEYQAIGWARIVGLEGFFLDMHRNAIAGVFSFGMIYCFILALYDKPARGLWLLGWVFFLVVAYWNNSRGALMGAMAAMPAVFMRYQWKRTLLVTGLGALALVMVSMSNMSNKVIYHDSSISNGRTDIWHVYIEHIKEKPLFGHGIRAYINNPRLIAEVPPPWPNYPHSIYLDLVYETGVTGLLFWLGWVGWLIWRILKGLPAGNVLVWSLGGGVLAYIMTHGLVDFTFYSFGIFVPLLTGVTLFFLPVQKSAVQEAQ